MFGGKSFPVSLKGKPDQIEAFSDVLASEKKYKDVFDEFGSNHPQTARVKSELQGSIKKFTKLTKIPWPLK